MTTERSTNITIGGDEYTLILTTKATKEIAGRYGGLENLGDKLLKSENFEMAIGEIVWLIIFSKRLGCVLQGGTEYFNFAFLGINLLSEDFVSSGECFDRRIVPVELRLD